MDIEGRRGVRVSRDKTRHVSCCLYVSLSLLPFFVHPCLSLFFYFCGFCRVGSSCEIRKFEPTRQIIWGCLAANQKRMHQQKDSKQTGKHTSVDRNGDTVPLTLMCLLVPAAKQS